MSFLKYRPDLNIENLDCVETSKLQWRCRFSWSMLTAVLIGVAISYDRGRTFQRLANHHPIVDSQHLGFYGSGQPSVVRAADGYFYMLYSDIGDTSIAEPGIKFLRSPEPTFQIHELVAEYPGSVFGGVSLDFAFNRGRNQFEVVANPIDLVNAHVLVTHLDRNLIPTRQVNYVADIGYSFGEGIGITKNEIGDVIPFQGIDGRMHMNFMASTFDFDDPRGEMFRASTIGGDLGSVFRNDKRDADRFFSCR